MELFPYFCVILTAFFGKKLQLTTRIIVKKGKGDTGPVNSRKDALEEPTPYK